MKRLCLLVITAFLCLESTAQRWNLNHKNSIDFIFGVDYNFRLLSSDSNEEGADLLVAARNREERAGNNLRLGFNYNYFLSEKLFLKSGISFSNPGYKANVLLSLQEEGQILRAHPEFFQSAKSLDYRNFYLEMPLAVRYVYSDLWCKSFVEAGISSNLYLGSRIKSIREDGEIEKIRIVEDDIARHHLSANISIGGEFIMYKRFPVFVQLVTHVQLTNIERNLINERLVSIGLETGVRHEF